jgi:O-antigen/teichoic acid export membrane protein
MKGFSSFKTHIKNDNKIIVKIIKTFATRGISATGTFMFNFILAIYLKLNDFGSFILLYSMFLGLNIIISLGRETAILRFGSILFSENKISHFKKLRNKNFFISFFIGSIIALVLIVFKNSIINLIFDGNLDLYNVIILMSISSPFFSYLNIQTSFFKAMKKPEIAPFFENGSMLLICSLMIFVCSFFLQISLTIVGFCFLISNLMVLSTGYLILNNKISKLKDDKTELFSGFSNFYATLPDLTLQNITNYFFKYSPILILGLYFSKNTIGFYSVANNIAFVINFILWVINSVYAPHFSKLYHDKNMIELSKLYKNSIIYMLFISVPIFIIIILYSEELLSLFGSEFTVASKGLMLLAFSQLINVLTGPAIYLLNLTGHEKQIRNIIIITTILNLVIGFILIPNFGFIGAIIATSIGLISQNLLAYNYANKLIRINFFK